MFGFDEIAAFTHEVETVFYFVREGKLPITRELVNLSLSAGDRIRIMLGETDDPSGLNDLEKLVEAFKSMVPETEKEEEEDGESGEKADGTDTGPATLATYRIRFRPDPDIFQIGADPLAVLNELRRIGECVVVAYFENVPALEYINPEHCYSWWDIVLCTDLGIEAINDVFIFVEDNCDLRIDLIDEGLEEEPDYKRIGEILVERGDLSCDELKQALRGQKRIGEILLEENLVEPGKIESALAEQRHVMDIRKKRLEQAAISSVRVPASRLDALVNLVGELVTVQARLGRMSSILQDEIEHLAFNEENLEFREACAHIIEEGSPLGSVSQDMPSVAEDIERITEELRENIMRIRMLPIGSIFARFKRLVRDLSAELGKDMEIKVEGEDTELDKTVLDQLNDPLVHLIRNAADHGIESPEVRLSAGKPRQGVIHLSARYSGASVVIRISDDGAGLDAEEIRAKAVELDLIPPDSELSQKEIFSQIFVHGFSTAQKVSDVSGRGVGMDVVRSDVEAIGGTIEIDSKKGSGTTTTLKLPLTLAIIDGLLVRTGNGHFVFPLSAVEECSELLREDADKARNRNIIRFRDKALPYVCLRQLFDIEEELPAIEKVVVISAEGRKVGFGVDHVVGRRQTVIKNLGQLYRNTEGLSGATILGDGTVALILDINRLVRKAEAGPM